MKKQLPTEAITNDLAESVFFQKSPVMQPNVGMGVRPHDRTDERGIEHALEEANGRTGERAIEHAPEQANYRSPEPTNARVPERATLPPPAQPFTRVAERPHDRAVKQESPEKAERYSFEIYPSQKERIEEHLYHHKRKTKQKISASHFIRTAIDYYFKTLT